MRGPYLRLATDPVMTLLSAGDSAQGITLDCITQVSPLHQSVEGGEVANVTLTLDNADGVLTQLFTQPPLGVTGALLGPDGASWFVGIIASITIDSAATIVLEA